MLCDDLLNIFLFTFRTIEIKPSGAIVNRSGTAASNTNGQNINRNKQNNMSSSAAKPNPSPINASLETSKPKSLVNDKSLRYFKLFYLF